MSVLRVAGRRPEAECGGWSAECGGWRLLHPEGPLELPDVQGPTDATPFDPDSVFAWSPLLEDRRRRVWRPAVDSCRLYEVRVGDGHPVDEDGGFVTDFEVHFHGPLADDGGTGVGRDSFDGSDQLYGVALLGEEDSECDGGDGEQTEGSVYQAVLHKMDANRVD